MASLLGSASPHNNASPFGDRVTAFTVAAGTLCAALIGVAAAVLVQSGEVPPIRIVLVGAVALAAIPAWLVYKPYANAGGRSMPATDQIAAILLCCAMALFSLNGVRAAGPLAAADAFLIPAAAFALPSMFARGSARRFLPPWWILGPAITFILIGTISVAFLDDQPISLFAGLRLVAAMILVPFTIGVIGGQLGMLVLLVDIWLASSVVNSGVAIYDFVFQGNIGFTVTKVESFGRSTGLTTHANQIAVLTCLTLPVAMARLVSLKRFWQQGLIAIVIGMLGLAVVSSGSRGGMVGFVIALAVTPFLLPGKQKGTLLKWGVAVALAGGTLMMVAAPEQTLNVLSRLTGGEPTSAITSTGRSDDERAHVREVAFEQFFSHPLTGAGFVNSKDAHNIFLQLLASTGLLGALAMVIFFIGYFAASRQVANRRDLPIEIRLIGAGAGATAIVWAALGMVENQLADRCLFVPCGFVLAAAWYASPAGPSSGVASFRRSVDSASTEPPRTVATTPSEA